ncbi:MAG TPA: superoxide dismutase family protein [Terricaulis sp.]|nr:superoxide dismutase family protein [Terricaulis sp.]HRP11474.1 superoxide dismutase family protein [Terricaulis sp.]
MKLPFLTIAGILALAACSEPAETPAAPAPEAAAETISVQMHNATRHGAGDGIGAIEIADSAGGAVFNLNLTGLPPGQHGFHVHEHASCAPHPSSDGVMEPALAAGAHWDPESTGTHAGPQGAGHLGDLPLIEVGADGAAQFSLTAPRITQVSQLRGRALMIHAGGDNYTDTPANGGGGARLACGVIG